MTTSEESGGKVSALRLQRALNPRPDRVRDSAFVGDNPFFDVNDLVQVKYEMLRRVREDGQRVSEASASFGFSRPSFYEVQAAFEKSGLVGLVPRRPGPRRAHKLSAAVLDVLEAALSEQPRLSSTDLAHLVEARFELSVHPRSVERALRRRQKGGAPTS